MRFLRCALGLLLASAFAVEQAPLERNATWLYFKKLLTEKGGLAQQFRKALKVKDCGVTPNDFEELMKLEKDYKKGYEYITFALMKYGTLEVVLKCLNDFKAYDKRWCEECSWVQKLIRATMYTWAYYESEAENTTFGCIRTRLIEERAKKVECKIAEEQKRINSLPIGSPIQDSKVETESLENSIDTEYNLAIREIRTESQLRQKASSGNSSQSPKEKSVIASLNNEGSFLTNPWYITLFAFIIILPIVVVCAAVYRRR